MPFIRAARGPLTAVQALREDKTKRKRPGKIRGVPVPRAGAAGQKLSWVRTAYWLVLSPVNSLSPRV